MRGPLDESSAVDLSSGAFGEKSHFEAIQRCVTGLAPDAEVFGCGGGGLQGDDREPPQE